VALLVYDDVSSISYVAADIAVLLSPEQQSLCVQALSLFNQPSLWSDWETNQALIDELVASSLLALETPVTITPLWQFRQQRIFADNFAVLNGNAQQWVSDVNQSFGGYFRQNAPAINDEMETTIALPAGVYSYVLKGIKNNLYGTAKVRFNGVLVGTNDMYNSTLLYNQLVAPATTFNLADSGVYQIKIKIDSKNASSTNYFFPWSWMDIIRLIDL